MSNIRDFPRRELPAWLREFMDDVRLAVKIHDSWPYPGPKPVRSGHPQTMIDPDEAEQLREHWLRTMAAIQRGEAMKLFEGTDFRIDPTPAEVDMAFRMIERMRVLDPFEMRAIWAFAKGRPEWKFREAQWRAIERGLWRMVTREPCGAAV